MPFLLQEKKKTPKLKTDLHHALNSCIELLDLVRVSDTSFHFGLRNVGFSKNPFHAPAPPFENEVRECRLLPHVKPPLSRLVCRDLNTAALPYRNLHSPSSYSVSLSFLKCR